MTLYSDCLSCISVGCPLGEPTEGGLFPGFGEFGSYCIIDPTQSNRPVAGWINFCPFVSNHDSVHTLYSVTFI